MRMLRVGKMMRDPGGIAAFRAVKALERKLSQGLVPAAKIEEVGISSSAVFDLGLLYDPKSDRVAMASAVTVGQMKQFVLAEGYRPTGQNAEKFNDLVKHGNAGATMVFTNKPDCLAFIGWALPKVHAQDPQIQTLRLPDDRQWLEMRETFRGQQNGDNWERLSDNTFRSFHDEDRVGNCVPEYRCDNDAFRLVGTYKKS